MRVFDPPRALTGLMGPEQRLACKHSLEACLCDCSMQEEGHADICMVGQFHNCNRHAFHNFPAKKLIYATHEHTHMYIYMYISVHTCKELAHPGHVQRVQAVRSAHLPQTQNMGIDFPLLIERLFSLPVGYSFRLVSPFLAC